MGERFTSLSKDFQEKIFKVAMENDMFAGQLGYIIGYKVWLADKDLEEKIFKVAMENSEFALGLSSHLCRDFLVVRKRRSRRYCK